MTAKGILSPPDGAGAEPHRSRRLIAGVGNPYGGDDGVGLVVPRLVHERIGGQSGTELAELTGSAFDVAERISGYDRVILIDALIDDSAPPGCLKRIELAECVGDTSFGLHSVGLAHALQLTRLAGGAVPSEVVVYGITVRQPFEFSEELSPALQARLPEIVCQICDAESEADRAGR